MTTTYLVRYVNSCQGSPVESRHRTAEAAVRAAERCNRTKASDSGSDCYQAEEWCGNDCVAIHVGGDWMRNTEDVRS